MTAGDRDEAIRAGIEKAREDFALLTSNRAHVNGTEGTLANAWLAAYANELATLARPCMTENRLVSAGHAPQFHAGQRIEFTRFDLLALKRPEWQAGEVTSYFSPEWQPVYGGHTRRLYVRVIGKRGRPIGREIDVSEFQVRLPQEQGGS